MRGHAENPKRVAVLSTYAAHGGAAVAALRHHDALRRAGLESTMVVMQPDPPGDRGIMTVGEPPDTELAALRRLVKRIAIESNRTGLSETWFSWPLDGTDLAALPAVREADVISVHWVSELLSQGQLERLFALGKPVVITMHDEWLFTGGCHYTAGCTGFTAECRYCPQLADDPVGVPATVLERRVQFGRHATGVVVSPSQWLAERSRQSRVFSGWPHEVIPYACDLDVFRPVDRAAARAELGCDDDRLWLLFVAGNLAERRKGFEVLAEALEHVASRENLADRLGLVCVGNAPETAGALSVPVRAPGFVRDEPHLARIYAACDALVLPSLEDNLPNTLIEALACGVPVIGSRVGGIPDFVEPGRSGDLFEAGNPASLAELLTGLAREPERVHGLRDGCRALAESSFAMDRHASRWLAVAAEAPVSEARQADPAEPLQPHVIRLVEARTLGGAPDLDGSDRPTGMALFERRRKVLEDQVTSVSARLAASERDSAARLAHIHELQQRIATMRDEGRDHVAQIHALSQGLREATETQRTQQQTMAELAQATSRLDELTAHNAQIVDEHKRLLVQHEKDKAELARLTTERQSLLDQHRHTASELARVSAEHEALLVRLEQTEVELVQMTAERDALQRHIERSLWTRLKGFINRHRPRLPRRSERKEAT